MTPPSAKPTLLSLQYFTYPDALGGAWKYTHEVNRRLAARGWQVHCLTCKPGTDFADEEVIDGVTFHRIGARDRSQFFRLRRRLHQRIQKIAENNRIGLVHVHNPLVGYLAMGADAVKQATWVVHVHSLWGDEERINALGPDATPTFGSPLWWKLMAIRYMERRLYSKARALLFLSQSMRNLFVDSFSARHSRLRVIPGGVDTDWFRPVPSPAAKHELRKQLNLPEDVPVLLTVRRLEPRMGLDRLIEAVAQVRKNRPGHHFVLVMVGTGSMEEDLKTQSALPGLQDCIRLPGKVDGEQLLHYYQAADLFVLPTAALEGFGLATVEAMASGLPVLGTPVGGTVEILKPIDTRMLFSSASVNSMAAQIQMFLDDPDSLTALAPLCRDHAVRQYGWDRVVDLIEEEYSFALKR